MEHTKKRVFISVYDKSRLVEFARTLVDHDREIVSSGGTAKHLLEHGVPCIKVEDVTGFPEIMDGRVKTLNPRMHGGILALRDNPAHMAQAAEHGITMIDLVVVNFYPFEQKKNLGEIDIGGPAAVRAAAKNNPFVTVIVDPEDYDEVAVQIEKQGAVKDDTRLRLAAKAFFTTSAYDRHIAEYLYECVRTGRMPDRGSH